MNMAKKGHSNGTAHQNIFGKAFRTMAAFNSVVSLGFFVIGFVKGAVPLLMIGMFLTNWGVFSALVHFVLPSCLSPRWFYHVALVANAFVSIVFWPLWLYSHNTMVYNDGQEFNYPLFICIMQHALPVLFLLLDPLFNSARHHKEHSHSWAIGAIGVLCYHLAYAVVAFIARWCMGRFPYPFLEQIWNLITGNMILFTAVGVSALIFLVGLSFIMFQISVWAKGQSPSFEPRNEAHKKT